MSSNQRNDLWKPNDWHPRRETFQTSFLPNVLNSSHSRARRRARRCPHLGRASQFHRQDLATCGSSGSSPTDRPKMHMPLGRVVGKRRRAWRVWKKADCAKVFFSLFGWFAKLEVGLSTPPPAYEKHGLLHAVNVRGLAASAASSGVIAGSFTKPSLSQIGATQCSWCARAHLLPPPTTTLMGTNIKRGHKKNMNLQHFLVPCGWISTTARQRYVIHLTCR